MYQIWCQIKSLITPIQHWVMFGFEKNLTLQKRLLAAACGTLIYKCASTSLCEETIKKLPAYLLALLCSSIQRKFGTNIQKITMTPGNLTYSCTKVFMSQNYHMATCPSETTYQGKVTVNSLGLAAGFLHSNVKVQQIAISFGPEASS